MQEFHATTKSVHARKVDKTPIRSRKFATWAASFGVESRARDCLPRLNMSHGALFRWSSAYLSSGGCPAIENYRCIVNGSIGSLGTEVAFRGETVTRALLPGLSSLPGDEILTTWFGGENTA